MRLQDRVALVTGSGGAMGRAIALRLAEEGAAIVVNDISRRRADETGALLAEAGRSAIVVRGNVTLRAEAATVVRAGLNRFGRIDILVNVVGGING